MSMHEVQQERRRAGLRAQIERLQGRRARSNDEATKDKLTAQIERLRVRLGRVSHGQ
jgi:hypothetical protein